MYFLLSVGEVVLADRIPDENNKMFMRLRQAGRLIFKQGLLAEKKLQAVADYL